MKPIYFSILAILCFASCETLVNDVAKDRLPSSDQALVVHGFLSPQDTLIRIIVGVSFPVTGQNVIGDNYTFRDGSSIPGATVTLSDGSKTVNLTQPRITTPTPGSPSVGNHYQISSKLFQIVVGQTYTLKVSVNGQSVESSCTIPKAVKVINAKVDSVAARYSPPGSKLKDRTFKLFWQDPAGVENFYRVTGFESQFVQTQTGPAKFEYRFQINEISFRDNNRDGDLSSDQQGDGALMASGTGRLFSYYGNTNVVLPNSQLTELILISCDKNYYLYHKSLANYQGNNPFSEPSLVPSNIKGGLGCFAGYNISRAIF